jgi:hypothetical protein
MNVETAALSGSGQQSRLGVVARLRSWDKQPERCQRCRRRTATNLRSNQPICDECLSDLNAVAAIARLESGHRR